MAAFKCGYSRVLNAAKNSVLMACCLRYGRTYEARPKAKWAETRLTLGRVLDAA